MSTFWLNNPSILFSEPLDFWPCGEGSFVEKVNALSRFFIYTGCLLAVYNRDIRMLAVSVIILIMITVVVKSKGTANTKKPVENRKTDDSVHNQEPISFEPEKLDINQGVQNRQHSVLRHPRNFDDQRAFAEFVLGDHAVDKSRCDI